MSGVVSETRTSSENDFIFQSNEAFCCSGFSGGPGEKNSNPERMAEVMRSGGDLGAGAATVQSVLVLRPLSAQPKRTHWIV